MMKEDRASKEFINYAKYIAERARAGRDTGYVDGNVNPCKSKISLLEKLDMYLFSSVPKVIRC